MSHPDFTTAASQLADAEKAVVAAKQALFAAFAAEVGPLLDSVTGRIEFTGSVRVTFPGAFSSSASVSGLQRGLHGEIEYLFSGHNDFGGRRSALPVTLCKPESLTPLLKAARVGHAEHTRAVAALEVVAGHAA